MYWMHTFVPVIPETENVSPVVSPVHMSFNQLAHFGGGGGGGGGGGCCNRHETARQDSVFSPTVHLHECVMLHTVWDALL